MDVSKLQQRIDKVNWYHEFDFGNGLKARATMTDTEVHRRSWEFIELNLDTIDFRNKSVLDIGCWDGYWSFSAERRGARSVLATDDHTQNWSADSGIFLARELLKSKVEVNLDVSVYELEKLNRKFDIIMFMGVYYHLFDPFYALTQVRHCCHENTLVVVEGAEATILTQATAQYNFYDHGCEWLPTQEVMEELLKATYFEIISLNEDPPASARRQLPSNRWRLLMMAQLVKGNRADVRKQIRNLGPGPGRLFIKCRPFVGESDVHYYRPPFGLHQYDPRFRDS